MTIKPTEEELLAYIDDELSPQRKAEVEAAIEADPSLKAFVDEHQSLTETIRNAWSEEPLSSALEDLQRDLQSGDETSNTTPFRHAKPGPTGFSGLAPLGMAASFVLGAVAVMSFSMTREPVLWQAGGKAGPVMSASLNELPSGEVHLQGKLALTPTHSFRDVSGTACRQFTIEQNSGVQQSGIACLREDQWQLEILVATGDPSTGYEAAGGETDPLVATQLRLGVTSALDPAKEKQLIDNGWMTNTP